MGIGKTKKKMRDELKLKLNHGRRRGEREREKIGRTTDTVVVGAAGDGAGEDRGMEIGRWGVAGWECHGDADGGGGAPIQSQHHAVRG